MLSRDFQLVVIWLLGGSIALFAALIWLPVVFFEDDVLLAGHDSYYHARRILDAVSNPAGLFQFDSRIHVPEGSWVPWPWGYDYLMAWLVRTTQFVTGPIEPLKILVFIPPIWVLVNAGLLLGITGVLDLRIRYRLLVLICFAFSPLTQILHGAGRIDHHYFEFTLVLLFCLSGLYWFKFPRSFIRATICGIVLGTGLAFHNGLFVLQLPLLLSLAVLWFKGISLPRQATIWFAISLVVTSGLMALPSIPFRQGMFSYYLLSWFHIYISIAVAVIALVFLKCRKSKQGVIVLGVVGILLSLPMLSQVLDGLAFVKVDIAELKDMPEAISPIVGLVSAPFKFTSVLQKYTGLILIFPLILVACLVLVYRSENPKEIFFYIFLLFGGSLLLMQFRFHHFGSIALYLPIIYWLQKCIPTSWGRIVPVVVVGLIGAAYVPALAALRSLPPPGGSYDYTITRSVYPPLVQACRNKPGVVLADHNDGHYIRFHTECSVIANNLILSNQSREKILQVNRMFEMNGAELRRYAPWVKYIFVRRNDNVISGAHTNEEVRQQNFGLRRELLFYDTLPKGFRLIYELKLQDKQQNKITLARIIEVFP